MAPSHLSRRLALGGPTAVLTAASVPPAEPELWTANHWAVKWHDNKKISLALYRKRLGMPQPGDTPRPVLFLVHGSSAPGTRFIGRREIELRPVHTWPP